MQEKNELVFELKGRPPDQMPIARVAAYMKEFASLLGGKDVPLFSAVRRGSTCIAAAFPEGGGLSTARSRIIDASRGLGPKEAQGAFDALADMSREDRSPARVLAKSGTVVHFPKSHNRHRPLSVYEMGSVTGRITGMVDDKDGGAKARIRPIDGGPLVYAAATAKIADSLGEFFRKTVRVYGHGEWRRDDEGKWACAGIEIKELHQVENVTVFEAVKALRELDVEWIDSPFDDLDSASGQA